MICVRNVPCSISFIFEMEFANFFKGKMIRLDIVFLRFHLDFSLKLLYQEESFCHQHSPSLLSFLVSQVRGSVGIINGFHGLFRTDPCAWLPRSRRARPVHRPVLLGEVLLRSHAPRRVACFQTVSESGADGECRRQNVLGRVAGASRRGVRSPWRAVGDAAALRS